MSGNLENGFVLSDGAKSIAAELIAAGVLNVPKQKRKRVDWERLLVYEYILRFYPETPHWLREEVGPMPEGYNNQLYNRTRRWADAIIRAEDEIIVIEGKMKAEPNVIGQVLNYKNLIPQTPMLAKYKNLPVRPRVITAMITDQVKELIENSGIEVEIFKPSNYDEWYEKVMVNGRKKQD